MCCIFHVYCLMVLSIIDLLSFSFCRYSLSSLRVNVLPRKKAVSRDAEYLTHWTIPCGCSRLPGSAPGLCHSCSISSCYRLRNSGRDHHWPASVELGSCRCAPSPPLIDGALLP